MSKRTCIFLVVLLFSLPVLAQPGKAPQKYPSLFWEITGNGLSRPSYLFGTMHVSNKMVFHLSDSFYLALKSVDAVALELNPEVWQGQMVDMNLVKQNYSTYTQAPRGDYLTENSFRINKFSNELKQAMSSEPAMVNSLLYRSYKSREDFEEDTFLDLYIYQTGKKLGKRGAGVEDYFESEKLVMEAYADMAREKKKKSLDLDVESMYNISEKTQEAYRRGDLDLLDSLNRLMDRSDAFTEKFLYKRNEIQAYSMDTIMKKSSLFVGVGAAHLPGKRGVIEILRNMGYHLRPIFMNDRDAEQKEEVDKRKVPVSFSTRRSEDGFYTVDMPGPLYNISDDSRRMERRQYSDMSNGSYYVVTRVKTYSAFLGQPDTEVMKQVDSVLYENIPGKILSKKAITRNGYSGYDISNRTRRGDLQRYNIFVTPFEILIFKMSGKENYVDGKEGEQFFSSIQFREAASAGNIFEPAQGGFSIRFPQTPSVYFNENVADGIDRWEYNANDPVTGDACLVFKKSVNNFRFIDEDSFDLRLIEESFRSPDFFDKQQSRSYSTVGGYPALTVKEKMKDGSIVNARYIIKGPDYYVLAVRSKNKKSDPQSFFNSFHFTPYRYPEARNFTDTFFRFSVITPVAPVLDASYRAQVEKTATDLAASATGSNSFWPKAGNALFKSDSTGEMVGLSVQEYPKYYYPKDNTQFWVDDIRKAYERTDMTLWKSDSVKAGTVMAYRFVLRDTGSSRTITRMVAMKGKYTYSMVCMGDTLSAGSDFISRFFNSFQPVVSNTSGIYDNKPEDFFSDLFSKDSAIHAKAQQSITSINYGERGVQLLIDAIGKLNRSDKDYFDTKTKLIAELGYIRDTTKPVVTEALRNIYRQAMDTSLFQNEVFLALSKHKTASSYALLKELLVQDPPVFDNSYTYGTLFSYLDDSLALAKQMFPEILQLSSLNDYKDRVTDLLVKLVDSGMLKAADYETHYPRIYFDAKIELKKQRGKDEKRMEKESRQDDDNNALISSGIRYIGSGSGRSDLDEYSILLLPFYDSNPNVPLFFSRLLQSNDPAVRMNAAVLLTKAGKPVDDSLFTRIAADDKYRGKLYSKLEKINRTDRFPARYRNQADMARSLMIGSRSYDKVDSISLISKQPASYNHKQGFVYFFKYRVRKDDDWKIGISGLQPKDEKQVSSDDKLALLTDKKIKTDQPLDEQLQEHLKKLLFGLHKSGRNFYGQNDYSRMLRTNEYNN
jgi:uncharacterized protein YbaP (TraB family)